MCKVLLTAAIIAVLSAIAFSQDAGKISGTITVGDTANPLSGAVVQIAQTDRTAVSDDNGKYEFAGLAPGRYTVIAHLAGFEDTARTITLAANGNDTVDLAMRLTEVHEQVTVTATGDKQASFDAIQPSIMIGSTKLLQRGSVSLGESTNNQPGVFMRSATAASARPVIRGFDGDRVLVATDGIRDGSVSALSENEAEPIDTMSLDRIEVVRGPSTLLYGSNAIGGVVNAISRHDDDIGPGLRGYLTGLAGTNNGQFSGSGGLEYGHGHWGFWGTGSGLHTHDYHPGDSSPELENTYARYGNGNGGAGYFANKGFFTGDYRYYRNHYGIPIDPADPEEREATIAARHHELRFNGGLRDLQSFIESIKFTFDYTKYTHRESEVFDRDPTTERFSEFHNQLYAWRGAFSQRRHGNLTGTFGFDGYHRNFFVVGEETLLPGKVNQTLNSGFVLEQIDFERATLQVGARVENSRYRPTDPSLIDRTMTGISFSAGARIALYDHGAFVANYSHASRLPDLEELYDNGPHDDTVSFEMGNPFLKKEVSDGIDVSVRHQSKRLRADANLFYYNIKNFVFLMPTGEIDPDTGLEIAEYEQAETAFRGVEASVDYDVHRYFSLFSGADYVRASFRVDQPLPRIPPFRGRVGLDAHGHGFDVRPELILAHDQNRLFINETRTPGYGVFNITGSYAWVSKHFTNTIAVNAFNLNDKFYMNHVSFIKDFSPEIGRGVRVSYTVRYF
jgi:iron complex outermembrane receptor protein